MYKEYFNVCFDEYSLAGSSIPYFLNKCLQPSTLVESPIPADLLLMMTLKSAGSNIWNCPQLPQIEIVLAPARTHYLGISFGYIGH